MDGYCDDRRRACIGISFVAKTGQATPRRNIGANTSFRIRAANESGTASGIDMLTCRRPSKMRDHDERVIGGRSCCFMESRSGGMDQPQQAKSRWKHRHYST
ncbi:hypothetical protein [Burkholderia vietnamiensis]|uniref:hypothetical protein n=1 Tax=Burkholderia vietnamiensis TaxID=60552 RepID=UPI00352C6C89